MKQDGDQTKDYYIRGAKQTISGWENIDKLRETGGRFYNKQVFKYFQRLLEAKGGNWIEIFKSNCMIIDCV